MDNIWTLMVFEQGQAQGVVLQYHGHDHAHRDREIMKGDTPHKVTVTDDFGRELTFRPMNVQTTLLQDVNKASEGNTIANVKNELANQRAQVRVHKAIEDDAEIKNFRTSMRLTQGMQGMQRPGILS